MEQWTGFKFGKEYVRVVYCNPAYLTYVQNASCKMLGWMNNKPESRLPGEISITSDMQMIPPYDRKQRRTKELLTEGERRVKKMGIPDHLTCLLKNLYTGQEATVRTGH